MRMYIYIYINLYLVSFLDQTTCWQRQRGVAQRNETKRNEMKRRREWSSHATCTAAWLTVREARVNVRRRMLFNFAFITRKTRTLLLAIASGVAGSLKRSRSLVRTSLSPRLRAPALACIRSTTSYVRTCSKSRILGVSRDSIQLASL